MYRSFIEAMKADWIVSSLYEPPLIGCTPEQLEILRLAQQVDYLPALYCEFMLNFGVKSGGLFHDSQFRFPQVSNFKNGIISLLPSPTCFVFLRHDYETVIGFFETQDRIDDPMIYRLSEDDPINLEIGLSIRPYNLLSEFLVGWVQSSIKS